MLRKLIAACALTIVANVCWAGQYDGIWYNTGAPEEFQIIRHQDNGAFLLVFVSSNTGGLYGSWGGTFIGTISGNTASLFASDTMGTTNTRVTMTFSSTSAGTFTASQCSVKPGQPADVCPPLNTPFPVIKIF